MVTTVILLIMLGIFGLGMLVAIYLIIKNAYCYKLSMQIGEWVFCYRVLTAEGDIDYDIDCYVSSYRWFNPFTCWTKRGMCVDKEKYDKLKKFIDEHQKEIEKLYEIKGNYI